MKLKCSALAGTLESSDVQVSVEPSENGIELMLTSSVISQFGKQIKATVLDTLADLGITDIKITMIDQGALDTTIRARVQCAVYRGMEQSEQIPWGVTIK